MRINLLLFVFLFSIYSCTVSKIRVNHDEFKDEIRIVLDQSFYVVNHEVGLHRDLVKLKVERVVKKGVFYDPKINLTIDAEIGYGLDNELFVKVDDQVHKLDFQNNSTFNNLDKESSSSVTAKASTTTKMKPVVTTTKPSNTDDEAYNYSTYQVWATLDKSTVQDILAGESMLIRFYLNHEPVTLKLTGEKLKRWKDFLNYGRPK